MAVKKKKNDPKSALIAFAVIFAVSIIGNLAEEMEDDAVGAIFGIIITVIVVILLVKKKKKKNSAADGFSAESTAVHTPTASVNTNYYNECDYGDYNCDFSHDYQSRVKQLNDWLKNGIIDKAEYKVMLEKYRKNYEEHHN